MTKPTTTSQPRNAFAIRARYDVIDTAGLPFDESEKMTKESFKDEADINKIIDRARRTGMLPDPSKPAQYLDLYDVPSYQEALERVRSAQQTFFNLPAPVRADCDNDPSIFLDKLQDPSWAIKHGLATPTPQPDAPAAPAASSAGQADPKSPS